MKRFLNLLMVAFVWMMTGCSVSNTPEAVALEFTKALHKTEFDEAMEYCTEDTKAVVIMQKEYFEKEQKKNPVEITNPDVSIVSCEVAEDEKTAIVKVSVKNSCMSEKKNDAPLEFKLNMVKVDGKWLAEYSVK